MSERQVVTSGEEVRRIAEARRVTLGITKEDVARRAGFDKSSFWAWQKYQRRVTLEAGLCYLTALGLRLVIEPIETTH
jgi:hypothetical protein